MKLKHEDTRRIALTVATFLVLALASLLLPTAPAMIYLAGLALLLILVTVYGLNRDREADLSKHLHQVQAALDLYTRETFRQRLPPMTGWAASAVLLSDISSEIRLRKPKLILELGSGVSTIVMAYALEEIGAGRIVSLEHHKEFLERTQDELERHGLTSWVELRHAPLKPVEVAGKVQTWYDTAALEGLSEIDLVVIDGPPRETHSMARYPTLPVIAKRLAANAVIVLDDADRRDEQRCIQRWREEFPDLDLELRDSPKGTAVLRRRLR